MQAPINLRRGQRPKAAPLRGRQIDRDKFAMERVGPDGTTVVSRTIVEIDGDRMSWAEQRWISDDMLARLKASRDLNRRAPLGESHGGFQKVAEIPLSLLYDKLPPGCWSDPDALDKAMKRLLGDSDYRAFRADGDHRAL